MIVLGIETATAVCGAALVRDGRVLGESRIEAPFIHSEKLLSLVKEVSGSIGSDLHGIDGIAVSIGPGSFTGLRIGLSVAKGLAYALGKPLAAVPTLEAMAWYAVGKGNVPPGGCVLSLIDARRSCVYAAAYRYAGAGLVCVLPVALFAAGELVTCLPGDDSVFVVGDGAPEFQHALTEGKGSPGTRFVFSSPDRGACSSSAVALLGERGLAAGRFSELSDLEPVYVQDFKMLVSGQHSGVQS